MKPVSLRRLSSFPEACWLGLDNYRPLQKGSTGDALLRLLEMVGKKYSPNGGEKW